MSSEVLKMVCSHCGEENPFFEDQKPKRKVACLSCSGVLFELDDFAESYRITQNYRIYYTSLFATLGELNLVLMKKSEEIRKNTSDSPETLWQACLEEVFPDDIIQSLKANADFLKNENAVSDPDTRLSTHDYLENVYTLLEKINFLKQGPDLMTTLAAVRGQCRQTREFAGMMNSYLGIR